MTGSTLRYGSTGPDVVRWQTFLRNVAGFSQIVADGKFGPMTQSATKSYQSSRGLTADGVVGPLTWASASMPISPPVPVNEPAPQVAPIYTATPVPVVPMTTVTPAPLPIPIVPKTTTQAAIPILKPPTTTAPTRPILRSGSRGIYVAEWQRILRITADSIFGPNTVAATKSFQLKNGLTPDGVVGPKTWDVGLMLQQMPNRTPAPTTTRTTSAPRTVPTLRTPVKKKAVKPKLDLKNARWDRIAAGVGGVGLLGFAVYKIKQLTK